MIYIVGTGHVGLNEKFPHLSRGRAWIRNGAVRISIYIQGRPWAGLYSGSLFFLLLKFKAETQSQIPTD
jgi:hypothetical protein